MGPIDFHVEKILWKSMGPSTVWLPIFFEISYCVQQKKEIHTGLEQTEGE